VLSCRRSCTPVHVAKRLARRSASSRSAGRGAAGFAVTYASAAAWTCGSVRNVSRVRAAMADTARWWIWLAAISLAAGAAREVGDLGAFRRRNGAWACHLRALGDHLAVGEEVCSKVLAMTDTITKTG